MKIKRIVSLLLTAAMVFSCLPTAFAEGEVKYLPEQQLDENYLSDDMFYFASAGAQIEENDSCGSMLKIVRKGEAKTAESVKVTMTDVTASYGKDYKVKVYKKELLESNVDNVLSSKSMLEVLEENDKEEYNYSDAVVDGTVTAENQELDENAETSLTEEEKQVIKDSATELVNELIEGSDAEVEDTEDTTLVPTEENAQSDGEMSLSQGKENATGLKDDKVPMGYSSDIDSSSAGYMNDSIEEISEELNSANVVINFDEGETEKYLEIIPIDNSICDGTRQTGFNLNGVDGSLTSGYYGNFTLQLIDDEEYQPATVEFTETEYRPENGFITATVKRSGIMTSTLSVMLDTEAENAVEGRDYSGVHANVLFSFGIDERTVKIPVSSEYIKEDVSFKLKLQEAKECVIGANSEARGIITPDDKCFTTLSSEEEESSENSYHEMNLKDIITADALNLKECVTESGAHGTGHSYATGDNSWELYSAMRAADCSSWVRFEPGLHYEYSGFQIRWTRKAGRPTYGWTKMQTYSHKDEVWYDLYNRDTGRWENDTDNFFMTKDAMFDSLYFELRKNFGLFGHDPTLQIHEIKPILRPFMVENLGSVNTPQVIDNTGNKVNLSSEDIAIEMTNASSNKIITCVGNAVTLRLRNETSPKVYISDVEMVNQRTGEAVNIMSNLAVGTKTISVDISSSFINRNNRYIDFPKNDDHGLYGKFGIRVTLKNMPVKVNVKKDDRYNVTVWNGLPHTTQNGYDTYNVNLGDSLRYNVELSEAAAALYSWDRIRQDVIQPSTIEPTAFYRTAGTNYGQSVVQYSEINITPQLVKNENSVSVMIRKNDVEQFDTTTGIFTYPCRTEGQYNVYTIDSDPMKISNKEYALTAVAKNKEYLVPVWYNANQTDIKYSQSTYYHVGSDTASDNVIYLTLTNSNSKLYSINGTMNYDDAVIGGTTTAKAWYKASGVYAIIDSTHYGISNEKGVFDTYPATGAEGYYFKYKVNSMGVISYRTVKLKNVNQTTQSFETPEGKSYEITYYKQNEGDIIVSSTSPNRPHATGITARNVNGTVVGEISINDSVTTLTATIQTIDATTGKEYEYSYEKGGQTYTRVEKPIAVDFVVYDPKTHVQKTVLKGAKTNDGGKTWSILNMFEIGHYAQYKAGDLLYVRVTTDRYIGNGCSYDEKGQEIEVEALKKTEYSPVKTNLVFTQRNQKVADPITIEMDTPSFTKLPLIGTLNTMVNAAGISVGISETPTGGVRVFFGKSKVKGTFFADDGTPLTDAYTVQDLSNIKADIEAMRLQIKYLGDKNKLGFMSLGIPAWTLEPMAGIYLEFAIYHDPKAVVTDRLEFTGGGGYIGIIGSFRYTYYMLIHGIPAYVGGDCALTLKGEFGIAADKDAHIAFNDPTQEFFDELIAKSHFGFVFEALLNVNAYAGGGICNTIGIRGGFALNMVFIANPVIQKSFPGVRKTGFDVTGQIKFWADAVLITIPIPVYTLFHKRFGYFADVDKIPKTGEDVMTEETSDILSKPRSESASEFVANDELEIVQDLTVRDDLETGEINENTKTIIDNSYDDAKPQLISIGDDKQLMVYLDDDKDRNDTERTVLKYMVRDKGIWSEPCVIQDDGTADFLPNVSDAGNYVAISWVSKPADAAVSEFRDYVSKNEIYYTRIDKSTLTVEPIKRLTEDDCYDTNPRIAYDDESGDTLVLYQKSEVPAIINSSELLKAVSPDQNNAELMYMLFDGESQSWITDKFFENEVADGAEEDLLISQFKGQRFVKSQISDFEMNNPVIADFVAKSGKLCDCTYDELMDFIKGEGYKDGDEITEELINNIQDYLNSKKCTQGFYAYSIDADNSLDTDADREMYVQIYDYENHKTGEPIRITNDNVSDTNPQLVNIDGSVYLAWLSGGKKVKYLNLTDMKYKYQSKDEGEEPEYNVEEAAIGDGTTINAFKAYASEDGMYIVWQQNSPTAESETTTNTLSQDLYISGCAVDGEDNGYMSKSWSKPICIASNSKVNELPEFVGIEGGKFMTVNSEYDMDISGSIYAISNAKIVENIYNPVSELKIDVNSLKVLSPDTDNDVNFSFGVINNGILSSYGVKYTSKLKLNDVELCSSEGVINDNIPAGCTETISNSLNINDYVGQENNIMLEVSINEIMGYDEYGEPIYSEAVETESMKLFADIKEYSLADISITQENDVFVMTGNVSNTGTVDGNSTDVISVTTTDGKTVLSKSEIGRCLSPNESAPFSAIIEPNDDLAKLGYFDCKLGVTENSGAVLSEEVSATGYVVNPFNLAINGDSEIENITIKQGDKLTLNGSYEPYNYYRNCDIKYTVADSNIAELDENVLKGVNVGETTLHMTVDPYGGSKDVNVVVVKKPQGGGGGGGGSVAPTPTPTATPEPTAEPTTEPVVNKYSDVKESDWFYGDVQTVTEKGIMNGTSKTAFEPYANITRAMFVTMLHRMDGEKIVDYAMPFTDVKSDEYYTEAVRWAASENIVKGITDKEFCPDKFITREEIATIIHLYAKYKGIDVDKEVEDTNTLSYHDIASISDWAAEGVHFCLATGILNGDENGNILPKNNATRAETAAMTVRYLNRFEK